MNYLLHYGGFTGQKERAYNSKLERVAKVHIEQVKQGKVMPLKEKTERARKNLKRAGLI